MNSDFVSDILYHMILQGKLCSYFVSAPAPYVRWFKKKGRMFIQKRYNETVTLKENETEQMVCTVGISMVMPRTEMYLVNNEIDPNKQIITDQFQLQIENEPSTKHYDGTEDMLGEIKYKGLVSLNHTDHGKVLRCEAITQTFWSKVTPGTAAQVIISVLCEFCYLFISIILP